MANIIHDVDLHKKKLKIALLNFANISEPILNQFLDLFYVKYYKNKTIIISPNNTDFKGYFIVDGTVRIHHVLEGKEITSDFRESNSFFMNGYSMFTKLPNLDYFTALENTTCLVIDWSKLENILSKHHELEHLGRKIIEWHYAEAIKSSYNSLFLSVEDRYNHFLENRSSLLNKVKLKDIATYLGISPETLSRLRAK